MPWTTSYYAYGCCGYVPHPICLAIAAADGRVRYGLCPTCSDLGAQTPRRILLSTGTFSRQGKSRRPIAVLQRSRTRVYWISAVKWNTTVLQLFNGSHRKAPWYSRWIISCNIGVRWKWTPGRLIPELKKATSSYQFFRWWWQRYRWIDRCGLKQNI